jgi:hypothetical protein
MRMLGVKAIAVDPRCRPMSGRATSPRRSGSNLLTTPGGALAAADLTFYGT